MAEVILPITLAVTVTRTLFVVDAIRAIAGYSSVIHRAAEAAKTTVRSVARSGTSTWAQNRTATRAKISGTGSSKVRSLHIRLVVMHIMAIISQSAAVLKYALPVTPSSCKVTYRVMMAFTLIYDMSLVVFLLAKVDLTNGNRKLALWEKVIVWLSRAYAWIYLPFVAIYLGATYPGDTNEDGTFCNNGYDDDDQQSGRTKADNAVGYATNNASLIVQFVLLLVLFVRPLLVQVGGTQSGNAAYRGVVIRNLVCTVTLVIAYLVTTVVVVTAVLSDSPDNNTASQVADITVRINILATLTLIEISLPLGFTSGWKAFSSACCTRNSAENEQEKGNQPLAVKEATTNAARTSDSPEIVTMPHFI